MNALSLVRRGDLIDDINTQLAEVVQAVDATGKAGALTITLKVVRKDLKSGSMICITDKVKQKLPELPSPETMLYADADGELFEDDPRQGKLFDQPKATIKPAAIEHQAEDVADVIEPDQTTKFRKVY